MNVSSPDARYLATLQQHWRRNKAFPAMAKLADVLGLRSSASVFGVVGRLAKAGYLERVDGCLAPTKAFFSYRLLGSVRAGLPQEAPDESFETLSAEDFLVQHPDRTSYATVRGDSMSGIGLLDGDIVVVEHNTPTRPRDVVVAVVDDRITVKTLVLEAGEYILRAENPNYEDIRPGNSLEVLGVVVGSFRRIKR